MVEGIKPPGSGRISGLDGLTRNEGADEAGAIESSESVGESHDIGSVAPATEAARAHAVAAPEHVRRIADELRAGRIDAEQAVQSLIEHQLSGPMVAALPAELRAHLETQLRELLEHDPTFAALLTDLEQT